MCVCLCREGGIACNSMPKQKGINNPDKQTHGQLLFPGKIKNYSHGRKDAQNLGKTFESLYFLV